MTDVLAEVGMPSMGANLVADDPLPPLEEVSAVVSFGGLMSVLDIEQFPFLVAERRLLADAVAAGTPVLGICLGAQLLSLAAGGGVFRLPARFVDFPELVREPAAADDPVFAALPTSLQVVEWHEDAVDAPAGATILAQTPCTGCSVYRVGAAAWGTQIHLELDGDTMAALMTEPAEREALAEVGVDPAWFAETAARVLATQAPSARPVMAAFAGVVRDREA